MGNKMYRFQNGFFHPLHSFMTPNHHLITLRISKTLSGNAKLCLDISSGINFTFEQKSAHTKISKDRFSLHSSQLQWLLRWLHCCLFEKVSLLLGSATVSTKSTHIFGLLQRNKFVRLAQSTNFSKIKIYMHTPKTICVRYLLIVYYRK